MSDDLGHGLLLAFDTDSEDFMRGFEAGRLWERIKWDKEEFAETMRASNAEMILRIGDATERGVRSEELRDDWIEVIVDAA